MDSIHLRHFNVFRSNNAMDHLTELLNHYSIHGIPLSSGSLSLSTPGSPSASPSKRKIVALPSIASMEGEASLSTGSLSQRASVDSTTGLEPPTSPSHLQSKQHLFPQQQKRQQQQQIVKQNSIQKSDVFYVEDNWRDIVTKHASLDKRKEGQQDALWELLTTEVNYIKRLKVVKDLFYSCLLSLQSNDLLCDIDTDKMFSNITQVYDANNHFWNQYLLPILQTSRMSHEPLDPTLMTEGFVKFEQIFYPYTKYCLEHSNCLQYVKQKHKENELFKAYVVWCETRKDCERLRLMDLLVKPMQRLTKYSLLLKAILRKTDAEPEALALKKMNECVEQFVLSVDASLRRKHEEERLAWIASRIESYDVVDTSNDDVEKVVKDYCKLDFLLKPMLECRSSQLRQLIMEGSNIKLKDPSSSGKTDVHLFLFTDLLLICKKSLSKKANDKVRVIRPPLLVDRLIPISSTDASSSESVNLTSRLHHSSSTSSSSHSNQLTLVYLNEFGVAASLFYLYSPEVKTWQESIRKAQKKYQEAKQKAALSNTLSPNYLSMYRTTVEDDDSEGANSGLVINYINNNNPHAINYNADPQTSQPILLLTSSHYHSSPRSSRSSLLHSYSGSIEMSEGSYSGSTLAIPHHQPPPAAPPTPNPTLLLLGDSAYGHDGGQPSRARSFELGDLRNPSLSVDNEAFGRSHSMETRSPAVILTSPRPERRAFLLRHSGSGSGSGGGVCGGSSNTLNVPDHRVIQSQPTQSHPPPPQSSPSHSPSHQVNQPPPHQLSTQETTHRVQVQQLRQHSLPPPRPTVPLQRQTTQHQQPQLSPQNQVKILSGTTSHQTSHSQHPPPLPPQRPPTSPAAKNFPRGASVGGTSSLQTQASFSSGSPSYAGGTTKPPPPKVPPRRAPPSSGGPVLQRCLSPVNKPPLVKTKNIVPLPPSSPISKSSSTTSSRLQSSPSCSATMMSQHRSASPPSYPLVPQRHASESDATNFDSSKGLVLLSYKKSSEESEFPSLIQQQSQHSSTTCSSAHTMTTQRKHSASTSCNPPVSESASMSEGYFPMTSSSTSPPATTVVGFTTNSTFPGGTCVTCNSCSYPSSSIITTTPSFSSSACPPTGEQRIFQQKRGSRSERRYHTTDAINEGIKRTSSSTTCSSHSAGGRDPIFPPDSSRSPNYDSGKGLSESRRIREGSGVVHKRLSLNYGPDNQSQQRLDQQRRVLEGEERVDRASCLCSSASSCLHTKRNPSNPFMSSDSIHSSSGCSSSSFSVSDGGGEYHNCNAAAERAIATGTEGSPSASQVGTSSTPQSSVAPIPSSNLSLRGNAYKKTLPPYPYTTNVPSSTNSFSAPSRSHTALESQSGNRLTAAYDMRSDDSEQRQKQPKQKGKEKKKGSLKDKVGSQDDGKDRDYFEEADNDIGEEFGEEEDEESYEKIGEYDEGRYHDLHAGLTGAGRGGEGIPLREGDCINLTSRRCQSTSASDRLKYQSRSQGTQQQFYPSQEDGQLKALGRIEQWSGGTPSNPSHDSLVLSTTGKGDIRKGRSFSSCDPSTVSSSSTFFQTGTRLVEGSPPASLPAEKGILQRSLTTSSHHSTAASALYKSHPGPLRPNSSSSSQYFPQDIHRGKGAGASSSLPSGQSRGSAGVKIDVCEEGDGISSVQITLSSSPSTSSGTSPSMTTNTSSSKPSREELGKMKEFLLTNHIESSEV